MASLHESPAVRQEQTRLRFFIDSPPIFVLNANAAAMTARFYRRGMVGA
jgi:hypothetical protein